MQMPLIIRDDLEDDNEEIEDGLFVGVPIVSTHMYS